MSSSFQPDWVSAPGSTISDLVETMRCDICALTSKLGIDKASFEALLKGELRIDSQLAKNLSDHLGFSDSFWLKREQQYRSGICEEPRTHTGSMTELFQFSDFRKLGWVAPKSTKAEKNQELLDFFGVHSATQFHTQYDRSLGRIAFRTSDSFETDEYAVLAWLRRAEVIASHCNARPKFNRGALLSVVPQIRKIMRFKSPEDFIPKLDKACSEAGVSVISLRAPKGCRASGASTLLEDGTAMIAMSFRHLSDDHFWFTFFHELAHLALHGESHLSIDTPSAPVSPQHEEEADELAEKFLFPNGFSFGYRITKRGIISCARKNGVPSGLVVGKLQHDKRVAHSSFNYLKRRYKWNDNAEIPILR